MESAIQLIDETWIEAPPDRVAPIVADVDRLSQRWPPLRLTVTRDRGITGIQWRVDGLRRGTAEIRLEPFASEVLLHHFLLLDPAGPPLSRRAVGGATRDFAWHAKRVFRRRRTTWKVGNNRGRTAGMIRR